MTDNRITSDQQPATSNQLVNETSPYLLQHATNPVYWYPWSAEALELARWQDKPILLSIGYSACHWCHVMAHESFEDPETAELMNSLFINIKVDREERPDLDRIYQTAQYLLTQRGGGWPLTMFLTPDERIPFFGGTYFPPEPRYGMPGFRNILERVAQYYREQKDAIKQQNRAFMQAMDQSQQVPATLTDQADTDLLLQGINGLASNFDVTHGGFGSAPKFPHMTNLELLLGYFEFNPDDTGKTGIEMALMTLEKMARGGIHDHLGGGFCRYSVDEKWMIPHFEKMLYDNGVMLGVYAQAAHLTGAGLFRSIATGTADWLIRDMQHPEGGFYSSLDADSEGEEGRFYVWTPDEVRALLTEPEYALFSRCYGLDLPPNFEQHWHHLYQSMPPVEVAEAIGLTPEHAKALLESACHKLLEKRRQRVWPGRDEKILAGWNGLAIKGMALAALHLDNPAYLASAEKALSFIHKNLWRDGRLIASYKDGKGHLNAYLDDYAFMLDAVVTMLGVKWSDHWFEFACQLADVLLDHFEDSQRGGFYFTSHDHESLLQRRRDFMDEATPSGNGIAARALLQLGYLCGNARWIDAATRTLTAARHSLLQIPHAHPTLLLALMDLITPPRQIVIRGGTDTIGEWQKRCHEVTGLRTALYAIPADATGLPEVLNYRTSGAKTAAWVCEGRTCRAPEFDLETLISDLKKQAPG